MVDLASIVGFDWDEGNARKNERHEVSAAEAEQIFFNAPLLLTLDARHSVEEERFHALGRTHDGRCLHVTFKLRASGTLIRVISARDLHRKERTLYEQAT
jgi:uncharacterized DUF497 family protein